MILSADIITSSGKHPERQHAFPLQDGWLANAVILAGRITKALVAFGESRKVRSGYRDPLSNVEAGGAPGSKHLTCQAADIEDPRRDLAKFLTDNTDVLEKCELWMESPKYTPRPSENTVPWVHLQSVPPKSGARIFIP